MIRVECEQCHKAFKVDEKYAGRRARCPGCGQALMIPAAGAAGEGAPASAPPPARPPQRSARPAPPPEAMDDLETSAAPEGRNGGTYDLLDEALAKPDAEAPAHGLPPMPGAATAGGSPAQAAAPRRSGLALTAMILGIVALPLMCLLLVGIIPALAALVLGIIALVQIGKSEGMLTGRGMALTGVILGGLCVLIAPVMIGIMLPALGAARRAANQMKNNTQMRGQHQAMFIFAQSNNSYLPGLDASGQVIPDGPATGHSGPGSSASARYWIMLNGQFVESEWLLNPVDADSGAFSLWTGGAVTTANHSYAMLSIRDPQREAGRFAEWRDTGNGQAILISDRNTGAGNADNQVRSVWTTVLGDWRGGVVWGDNHAEFVQSNRGFATRYGDSAAMDDNLFADGPNQPGASESGTTPGANALMIWD